ncbi:MAG: 50S ribosomal protein L35 [Deltaproteobacteria bacterium]|nr:50S ribosomal protein L35 [Deltaproteobacteria bacterium]
MKLKSNSGAKKRFKIKKSGKIKRKKQGLRHLLTNSKSSKRKRNLRHGAYVDDSNVKNLRRLLPYG